MGYAQNDVEHWVRQQNASRQKQQQMAALYASQMYRSCNQIPEAGHYQYWPVHHNTMSSSLGINRSQTSSSVDYMGQTGYGNVDAAINVHHFRDENYKVPDERLTMEQRQQRQSKMEWLLAVQHMLTEEQQVPMTDEPVDHTRTASFQQSRAPSSINWNSMPCGSDMHAGPCNAGNHMMNTSYASSAVRHGCYVPSWDAAAQHRWHHMQHEPCMSKTGVQNSFDNCQSADLHNRRYFGPNAPLHTLAESCQQSVRNRVMPAYAVGDCTRLYSICDPQACTCKGGMSSHVGGYYMQPNGTYGYSNVCMQPNCGCQQQVNRCNEFVNGSYVMPVGGSRQLTNNVQSRYQTDVKSWNSGGADIVKQRLMAASNFVQGQEVTLTPKQISYYGSDGQIVDQPVSTTISYAPMKMPTIAVHQKQPCGKKRKNSNILTAQLSGSKSKKLDSVAEWPYTVPSSRGGTLMNITSASLAHLAKGVENMSAAMQQTVQKGGPFRSIRGQGDHADGFDENANCISGGNLLMQVQAGPGVKNAVEPPTVPASACTTVTSSLCTFPVPGSHSMCSLTTVSTHSIDNTVVSTTGVDVVVTSKTPYTISYRPSGVLSERVSQGNVDTSAAARMMPVSNAHTVSSSHRHVASGESFSQRGQQEQCGIIRPMNIADAAKDDQQAAAVCTPLPVSMTSSVAVVQPQMMSGTQLFIADRCPEVAPVLNNFVLPTCMPSSTFRAPHSYHSVPNGGVHYQGFAAQNVSLSVGGSAVPVFSSSLNTDTDWVQPPDGVKSLSDSVAGGSPLSGCPQTNIGLWHHPSVSLCNRSFSQAHDATYAVQNDFTGSGVVTTQT